MKFQFHKSSTFLGAVLSFMIRTNSWICMIQDHLIVPWNSIQKGNKYHQIQDKQKKLVDPIPHISAQNYPQIGVAVQIEGDPRAPQIDVKNAGPKPSELECTWPIFSMEDCCWVKSVSIYPIPSMGLVYLPTFGWFFMVNVGKYTIHGWYGHGYFQYNKHNMSYAVITPLKIWCFSSRIQIYMKCGWFGEHFKPCLSENMWPT